VKIWIPLGGKSKWQILDGIFASHPPLDNQIIPAAHSSRKFPNGFLAKSFHKKLMVLPQLCSDTLEHLRADRLLHRKLLVDRGNRYVSREASTQLTGHP
jgi:hypothetical protein